MQLNKVIVLLAMIWLAADNVTAQPQRGPRPRRMAYVTDTVMVHDPVMAFENGRYYLLSTGMGLQWATSTNRKTWVVQPTPFIEQIPQWTRDSVPGFSNHVWAPDILRWHNRWWLAYSCSTFGKNTSAIGLMSADRLDGRWRDEGCIVASREGRDSWNAIDPAFIVDEGDCLWMTWGSFWDGIQIAKLDNFTSSQSDHSPNNLSAQSANNTPAKLSNQKTIARRIAMADTAKAEPNPTSRFAGRNAIEAPFILKHGDWYYLFVSWDYCCRGAQSNYRVAVGRSKQVDGPYTDREGKPMTEGGGTLFLEGDKQEFEAAGHCAVYDLPTSETIFICHGYSVGLDGTSILLQRTVTWTSDGWPVLPSHQ